MGQIVKTWVKVLGLNDPYRNHMAQGLNGNMGQIVIFLPLIKKMYICIGLRRPMLQASDYFRVTI
jgi:Fe2+ transport system protein B